MCLTISLSAAFPWACQELPVRRCCHNWSQQYYAFAYQVRFPILHISKNDLEWDRERMRLLYQNGLAMALMSSLVNCGTLILQTGINKLGTNIIVAHTAARKVFEIFSLPVSVFGASMATYCGQNYGAGKYDRIRQGLKAVLGIGCVFSVIILFYRIRYHRI